ncbi:c-type cytochrome [Roseibium sp. MMSF_3412]|uniref:c-type cytochrome n=1 Tax=Roseibium sp. MMSF_3412 TaxID=3046712 RepID=UPI00273DEA3A|nr:c-type cytochrome [Roseibium sp. MMSF_3412]
MFRCPSNQNPAVVTVQRRVLFGGAVLALILQMASTPAQAADPATGKVLALQWCASCHLVSDDQPSAASVSLPSFYDIAKDPDWTQASLATFLKDPHPKMPNMTLGNVEIANLASYISSLSPD